MSDTPTTDTPEPVEAVSGPQEAVRDAPAVEDVTPDSEPETFGRDYVERLRREAAEHRVKAKIADEANVHLLRAYADADGRLAEADLLPMSPDLLGDDGLVDPSKVHDAIDALLTERPYMKSRKPTTPLPMGVQPIAPAEVGWLAVLRGEAR